MVELRSFEDDPNRLPQIRSGALSVCILNQNVSVSIHQNLNCPRDGCRLCRTLLWGANRVLLARMPG